MATDTLANGSTPVISARGRWYIPVPWEQADDLHFQLRRRGCPATLCLDPDSRSARLELWPGVTPERALGELDGLRAGQTAPLAAAV